METKLARTEKKRIETDDAEKLVEEEKGSERFERDFHRIVETKNECPQVSFSCSRYKSWKRGKEGGCMLVQDWRRKRRKVWTSDRTKTNDGEEGKDKLVSYKGLIDFVFSKREMTLTNYIFFIRKGQILSFGSSEVVTHHNRNEQ